MALRRADLVSVAEAEGLSIRYLMDLLSAFNDLAQR